MPGVPSKVLAAFKTSWAGLRPMTPDRRPLIGAVLGFEGLVAATGHSSVGIFLAPLTARLVADAVEGKSSLLSHPELYNPIRFMDS
jgi:glycine/D-amino acid oxidase-like deaminating enzyme